MQRPGWEVSCIIKDNCRDGTKWVPVQKISKVLNEMFLFSQNDLPKLTRSVSVAAMSNLEKFFRHQRLRLELELSLFGVPLFLKGLQRNYLFLMGL